LSEQIWTFFWRDPNDFLSWLVAMVKTWLTHYDPETKQQSMVWQHSDSPCPTPKTSCLNFLGSKWPPPHWLCSKGQNYQCGVLLISAGAIVGHFEGKTLRAERSSRGSCSCKTMSQITGHLQPKWNWPTWASNVLITHPILRVWPRKTTTCSLDWKNNWRVAIFCSTQEVIPATETPSWTDKFLNFFWVACKSYSNGLRSVLSFVGIMLNNPKFGHCSLLPSCSG
jgi:hypothetical protein